MFVTGRESPVPGLYFPMSVLGSSNDSERNQDYWGILVLQRLTILLLVTRNLRGVIGVKGVNLTSEGKMDWTKVWTEYGVETKDRLKKDGSYDTLLTVGGLVNSERQDMRSYFSNSLISL